MPSVEATGQMKPETRNAYIKTLKAGWSKFAKSLAPPPVSLMKLPKNPEDLNASHPELFAAAFPHGMLIKPQCPVPESILAELKTNTKMRLHSKVATSGQCLQLGSLQPQMSQENLGDILKQTLQAFSSMMACFFTDFTPDFLAVPPADGF